MRFFVKPLTDEHIQTVMGWRYAAPYAIYNEGNSELSRAERRGLFDGADSLCGFFCWGEDARVPAALPLYQTEPDALDIGIGLAPEYAGRGLGLFALESALAWLAERMRPPAFRLAVHGWNVRAQRVYARAGFEPRATFGGFLLMERDDRPWLEASRPLVNGMEVYPDDPPFERRLYYKKEDCGWDMSVFGMTVHAGTHIDAPAHIGMPGGVETIPLETLSGVAQLVDYQKAGIREIRSPKVLIKGCAQGLSEKEARELLSLGVRMIGINGLTVGSEAFVMDVHRLLLEAGVVILENAALEGFAEGFYQMRCLPLLMPGSDGAPVRLLLRPERRLT